MTTQSIIPLKKWTAYFQKNSAGLRQSVVEGYIHKALTDGRSTMKMSKGRVCYFARLSEKACRFEYCYGQRRMAVGIIAC